MKIEKIKINHWRSIKELEIDGQSLLVFIGANNAGKSNILSAILFFFDEIKPDENDIGKIAGQDIASVEIIFNNLSQDDLDQYTSLICGDKIIIKKIFNNINSEVLFEKYVQTVDINIYPYLDYNYENYKNRTILSDLPISSIIDRLYPSGTITKAKYKEIIDQYKIENPLILTKGYESIGRTNPLNINILYVPALKDINDEFSRGTISKLLKECFDDVFQHTTISTITSTIKTEINKLNIGSTDRPEPLVTLEEKISNGMSDWNAQFKIQFDTNIENILKSSYKVLIDDGIESDVTRKGHGFQRNLIFSLLKIRQTHHGRNQQNSILLFEEPELYLHPQAQKRIYEELKILSNDLMFTGLTTHSNLFIKLEDYQSICIVKKEGTETKKVQVNEDIFGTDKERFQLLERIDASRSEMFFANKVLIVEGITEKSIIPYIAQRLECYKTEYSLVMSNSKDCMPLYIKLCNAFKMPYIVIFDKDKQNRKSEPQKAHSEIVSETVIGSIDTTLGSNIMLDNDVEEELNYPGYISKETKPKRFESFEYTTNLSDIPEQLKSKVRSIYS